MKRANIEKLAKLLAKAKRDEVELTEHKNCASADSCYLVSERGKSTGYVSDGEWGSE